MCVQNVNANLSLFSDIRNVENQGMQEFVRPFNTIVAKTTDNGEQFIGDFYIVADFTLLATTNNEKKAKNVIANKEKINIIIRLTKSDYDVEKRLSLDIDEFLIDASDESLIKKNACVPYLNYKKIKRIGTNAIKLDPIAGLGDYVLKILVKRFCDTDWNVQSLYNLRIE